jgi:hypothetical protein
MPRQPGHSAPRVERYPDEAECNPDKAERYPDTGGMLPRRPDD